MLSAACLFVCFGGGFVDRRAIAGGWFRACWMLVCGMCVRVAVGGAVRLGIRFYGLGSGTAPFLSGLDLWQGMSAFGLDLYHGNW